jgi:integrase
MPRETYAFPVFGKIRVNAIDTPTYCGRSPHLDDQDRDWTIPAERMKAKREHRVPLSPRALKLAKAQPAGELLFPLSNMATLALLERMGRDSVTVHGFRSTFRDWTADQTNYPGEVCEMALAHTIGDNTAAAYRRGDLFEKLRALMQDWARYRRPAKAGAVTSIRRKA